MALTISIQSAQPGARADARNGVVSLVGLPSRASQLTLGRMPSLSVEQLAPELREILSAELARGNTIREIADWPPQCALFVSLARQFGRAYSISGSVVYAELNDPHYWKCEYRLTDTSQVLVCGFDE